MGYTYLSMPLEQSKVTVNIVVNGVLDMIELLEKLLYTENH